MSAGSLPTNPRLAAAARAVLSEPQPRVATATLRKLLEPSGAPISAWQSYLTQRGWISERAFESADKQTQLAGLAVLSAALSFPLTIAKSWSALNLPPPLDPSSGWHLCVVGARAEAALPPHIWAELSLLTGASKLAISFCGPSAAPEGLPGEREWVGPDGQRLNLSLSGADLFHRSSLGQALLARSRTQQGTAAIEPAAEPAPSTEGVVDVEAALPDAFVLFNPGLGEPGWERAWAPTMRALLASRRPLLMTALSHSDAARDVSFLEQQLKWGASGAPACIREPFAENAFASLLSAGGDGLAGGAGASGASAAGAAAAAQAGGSGGAANSCVRILGN